MNDDKLRKVGKMKNAWIELYIFREHQKLLVGKSSLIELQSLSFGTTSFAPPLLYRFFFPLEDVVLRFKACSCITRLSSRGQPNDDKSTTLVAEYGGRR